MITDVYRHAHWFVLILMYSHWGHYTKYHSYHSGKQESKCFQGKIQDLCYSYQLIL